MACADAGAAEAITSGAAMTLKAGQVNNATGRIASQQALDVSVTGLDQQGGQLFSKQSLITFIHKVQIIINIGIDSPSVKVKSFDRPKSMLY